MLPDILYFEGAKYQKESVIQRPALWMHREDRDTDLWGGGVRPCAVGGCPAVFTLNEPNLKTKITKHWQFYLRAINYNMTALNVSLLLHFELAFCNGTGFGDNTDPKRDYILGNNLSVLDSSGLPAYPLFDKDRTCSRNILAGREVGDYVELELFNGNFPPPMKPGKSLPATLAEAKLEDYLYNPKDHPWMFIVANRVTNKPFNQTSVAPFPRGAMYPWTGNNNNYSFVPHISREKIFYPKKYLIRLNPNLPLPSPYRIVT